MADVSTGRRFRGRAAWIGALVAGAFGLTLTATPVAAQRTPPPSTEPPGQLCRVYSVPGAEGQPQELRAYCRGRAMMLGPASTFEAITNEALQATLVDVRFGSERRVLLLSFRDDGLPLAEDLTGQIALAAGRGPASSIDGVELDVSGFARTGEVGVRGRPEDTGNAKSDHVNLGQQIALERGRGGGSQTQN